MTKKDIKLNKQTATLKYINMLSIDQIKPREDYYVVEILPKLATKSSNGTWIPSVDAEMSKGEFLRTTVLGKVIKRGPGYILQGQRVPLEIEVGSYVMFTKTDGFPLSTSGDDKVYHVLRESNVLAYSDTPPLQEGDEFKAIAIED